MVVPSGASKGSVEDPENSRSFLNNSSCWLRLARSSLERVVFAERSTNALKAAQIMRDHYIFEVLGLCSQETMGESDLEDALLDRLQEFLLEMGHGFCLEARQKRMLIGSEHFHSELRSRVP